MPLRLRGRAERYGHSFDRNKMSVDLSEYLVGQVLQSKRRQFGVLQKSFATADRDDWRLAVAGERWRKCFPDRLTEGNNSHIRRQPDRGRQGLRPHPNGNRAGAQGREPLIAIRSA